MKALIVIDVQNDFVEKGSLAVKNGMQILDTINKIINEYHTKGNLIVATKDFHPVNHISFASSHKGKEIFEIIDVVYGKQQLWPDHCVQNTNGSDFVKELNDKYFDKVILKGTNLAVDSYSGFFENDSKSETGLNSYLKSKNITELLMVGLALDYCVAYTAMDAAKLGYKVTIDLRGTKPINEDTKELFEKFKKLSINLIR